MKKILLSLITIASFSFANAQTKNKGTFEITPKIGYSSFSEYNDDGNNSSNSGVEFGVTGDYYLNNRWSLRSGLVFDKMGGKYDYVGVEWEDKLNYLSIPLNANWHFGSTRKWNLNFGFSPSFLLNAEIEAAGTTVKVPKNTIDSFQLGLTFGIGYKIEVNKKFGVLLDYQVFSGLTNIYNGPGGDIRNSGSSFNVGGVFEL